MFLFLFFFFHLINFLLVNMKSNVFYQATEVFITEDSSEVRTLINEIYCQYYRIYNYRLMRSFVISFFIGNCCLITV